jgi:site-specific recombinase XerD
MKSIYLRKKENNSYDCWYLHYYDKTGKRVKETLPFQIPKEKDPLSRNIARKMELEAEKILAQRKLNMLNGVTERKYNNEITVTQYVNGFISRYQKSDFRNIKGVFKIFETILDKHGLIHLKMSELEEYHIDLLKQQLMSNHKGEGAASYFARFKKVIKAAVREKVIAEDPSKNVTIKRRQSALKDILTETEIITLFNTKIMNTEVKNAFIFCCFTGLRWVDVKELKFKHLDYQNLRLKKIQSKTEIELDVPLKQNQFDFILPCKGSDDELVFKLPSHNTALKTLVKWCIKAGINKHITWHCARHSFATIANILGTDQFTMMKMMGLTSTKYLLRYTHVSDEQKLQLNDRRISLYINEKIQT